MHVVRKHTECSSPESTSPTFERWTSRLRRSAIHTIATSIRYKFNHLIIGGRGFVYQINICSRILAVFPCLNCYNIITGAYETFPLYRHYLLLIPALYTSIST